VAPVFEHGPGQAVIAPDQAISPVFLAEAEGVEVVVSELFCGQVRMMEGGVAVPEVEIALPRLGDRGANVSGEGDLGPFDPAVMLLIDGLDRVHYIAFEYLSLEDYEAWGGPVRRGEERSYDFQEAASYLAAVLAAKGPAWYYAVFYDPVADPASEELHQLAFVCDSADFGGDRLSCAADYFAREREVLERWQGREDEVRERSRELLREQVHDFLNWLQTQGVVLEGE
jgi:hypothetical protein